MLFINAKLASRLLIGCALFSLQGCQTEGSSSTTHLELLTSLLNLAQTTSDYKDAKNQSQAQQQQAVAANQARARAEQQRQTQLLAQQQQAILAEHERQAQVRAQQQAAATNNNPYPQSTGASGATNKPVIEPANQCISITREAHNWALMDNRCPYAIEVAWCYQGLDCKNGNWGYGNLATIGAGKNKYASSFRNSSEHTLRYFACKGANTRPVEDSEMLSHCEP